MKFLVVDDSSMIRRLIKTHLSLAGFNEVIEAVNGKEAVNAAKGQPVDLILMDWNMPELSGLEAVQAIRAGGDQTPIIMVTTESEKQRVVLAVKAGVNDYLVKPFSFETLIEKIRKLLPKEPA